MAVKFDDTFKLSATALFLNLGHPSLPLTLKWAVIMFIFYIFFCPVFVSMLYSSIYYDNFTKICTNLGLAVLFCIISCNYMALVGYKKCFKVMIKTTEEDLERSRELRAEDGKLIEKYVAKGQFASKFWLVVCILSGGVFFSKADLGTSYYALEGNLILVPIHELTYPMFIEERKNEFYMYFIIFGFQLYFIIFTCLMYVGFNPLGPIFIMHACGQIELAIGQVEELFLDKDLDVEKTVIKLQDLVRHIQHIYSFVDQIQQSHKILYEMCLKTSTVAIPISCFGIIESYNNGRISFDLICYVFAATMQCLIPCYYCEVLLSRGENLREAIYGCGWEKYWVPQSRSYILMMLTRTARPLGIQSIFCTICLKAFAGVANQAYTIFNVMNAAWN